MAELDQAVKKIEAKLRMLKFTRDDVPRIRDKKELKPLERLQKALEEQIDSVHEQKVQIQALRIEKGDEPDDVRKWTFEMEEQVAEFEKITDSVREAVKNLREDALREAKDEEEKKRRRETEASLRRRVEARGGKNGSQTGLREEDRRGS